MIQQKKHHSSQYSSCESPGIDYSGINHLPNILTSLMDIISVSDNANTPFQY